MMELKLTIRKDKTETVYKTDTRTINWNTFCKIVKIFDIKNLFEYLPQLLKNLNNIKSDNIKEDIKAGEIENIMPILNIVVNICMESMDKITDILADCFKQYDLTEEDIATCDFDEIIGCVIVLIMNVAQTLGLLKKTKQQ